jgi:GABA permease
VAVKRYLIVANQTLGGEHLRKRVRVCLTQGPCRFHVVVPASHSGGVTWTEGEARAVAERRLATALRAFRGMGAEVTGEVGDISPVRAIADALLAAEFDEIILSTLPPGPSRWLHQDVVHRVRRTFAVPCTHIVAEPDPAVTLIK